MLTDGEVTNTDAVIALATSHSADARIFTFGIGAGASHHLVRALARAGGGTAELIYPGERIEPKVLRLFARLLSPAVSEARIEWNSGTRVTQAPQRIPPVFADGRLLVYGLASLGRPSSVRLTANGASGPLEFDIPLSEVQAVPGRTVSLLAARARIRELEEGAEWLSGRGSRQRERKGSAATREIIALSVKYGLMSRETSFVAVERRETPVNGDVQLRKVPIALTTGWGERQASAAVPSLPPPRLTRHFNVAAQAGGVWDRIMSRRSRQSDPPEIAASYDPGQDVAFSRVAPTESMPPRRIDPTSSSVQRLIVLQAADGSWELTRALASIIGRDLSDLRAAVAGASGARKDIERAWATALAIAWLERNASQAVDEWKLLAKKGRDWIDSSFTTAPGGSSWIQTAHDCLR